MACFMACHACHARTQPLLLLSLAILQPNPTPIALSGIISSFDSLSPHLIRWPQRAWQAAGGRPHDGMGIKVYASGIAPCLLDAEPCSYLASVVHAGMADTKRWPRGNSCYS